MPVDDAAERIYEKIKSYMDESSDAELTDKEQKVILVGLLEVLIKEIVTIAVVDALKHTKIAVDNAIIANLKERNKQNGHL